MKSSVQLQEQLQEGLLEELREEFPGLAFSSAELSPFININSGEAGLPVLGHLQLDLLGARLALWVYGREITNQVFFLADPECFEKLFKELRELL